MDEIKIEHSLSDLIISSSDGELNDGQCSITMDNGCSYDGNFLNGLFHGKGTFIWVDGTVYEGDFEYGLMEGKGSYRWADGSTYQGGIKQGKRNGFGIFNNSLGQTYEGEWINGLKDGNGKQCYDSKGIKVYEGQWKNGNRHGYGIMKYNQVDDKYEGYWQNDYKHGRGVMIWHSNESNEIYTGDWYNDLQHGLGEHIWYNNNSIFSKQLSNHRNSTKTITINTKKQMNNIFRGQFIQGQRHGYGVFYYSDGSQYHGYFNHNIKQGLGIHVLSNNQIIIGSYINNHIDRNDYYNIYNQLVNTNDNIDINIQYYLHVHDIIGRYIDSKNDNNIDRDNYISNELNEIERLLLRYNQYLKTVYQYYYQHCNKNRLVNSLIYQSYYNNLYTQIAISNSTSNQIENTMYNKRNLLVNHISTCTLYDFIHLCIDMNVFDESYYNCYDIIHTLIEMKSYYNYLCNYKVFTYNSFKYVNSNTSNENISASDIVRERNIQGPVNADNIYIDELTSTRLCDISDNIYGYPYNSTYPDENKSLIMKKFITNKKYSDERYPLLEREFMELLVRCIADRHLSESTLSSIPSDNVTNIDLSKLIYKTLSEKVVPISISIKSLQTSFNSCYYHDSIQTLIYNESNYTLLFDLFNRLVVNKHGLVNEDEVNYIEIKDFIKLLYQWTNRYINNNLSKDIFNYFEAMSIVTNDLTIIYKPIVFIDFIRLLCRVMLSNMWIDSSVDNEADHIVVNNENLTNDETEDVNSNISISTKPLNETLYNRLDSFFTSYSIN